MNTKNFGKKPIESQLDHLQLTELSSLWKPLFTGVVAFVLPLGVDYLVPRAAMAVSLSQPSATWAETISLTSILTGYESIFLGLEDIGLNEGIEIQDSSITFSETIAAFTLTGKIGGEELFLNGQGFLFGDVGTENLTWTGNWLGTVGTQFVTADDSATFSLDGADGYTQLDFTQSGFSDFDFWDASNIATLTSTIDSSTVTGWSGLGKGGGIGGTVSAALADLETTFFSSGNLINSSLTIDGDAQSYRIKLDDSSNIIEGEFLCEESKNCNKVDIPEPTSIGSFLFLLALGIINRVRKFKVKTV